MDIWIYGYPKAVECIKSKENQIGIHWGVICAGGNGAARARGHNARYGGSRTGRMTGGQVWEAAVTGGGIRLASLNIRTGRSGGIETELRALHRVNVDVRFL